MNNSFKNQIKFSLSTIFIENALVLSFMAKIELEIRAINIFSPRFSPFTFIVRGVAL